MTMNPGDQNKAGQMAEKAIDDVAKLVKAEIGVAQAEMERQAFRVAPGTVALGAAGLLGLMGFQSVVFAAGFARPVRALLTGFALMGAAGVLGTLGFRALPESTREGIKRTLSRGVDVAKEQLPG